MSLPVVDKFSEKLSHIGLQGERKAVSLLILAFFAGFFFLLRTVARTEMPEWLPAFTAMFALYILTFLGVAASWFWGRWVAIGVGTWGATIAVWGVVQTRELSTPLVVLGLSHGLIALLLMGDSMAADFEGRPGWRTRLGLDDAGVLKLRRTITRAASSVPAIVLFALAPRQEDGSALVACAVVGIGALLLGRTLSLVALAAAAVGAFVLSFGAAPFSVATPALSFLPAAMPHALALYASLALAASLAPFAGPVRSFLRR